MKIEDILENDECILDIRTNQNTKFKKLITTENIKTLIRLCLKPNESLKENSQKSLRYTYYSCQILCSQNFLLFSKSIKNIRESNKFQNGSEKSRDNENSYLNENNSLSSDIGKEDEKNIINENQELDFINPKKDDIYIEPITILENDDGYYENFFHTRNDEFLNDIKDIYVEIKNPSTETNLHKDTKLNQMKSKYAKEEMNIINEILEEIFSILNSENYEKQTYLGYFQIIVNYLLFFETKVIIDFLFKDSPPIISKLYSHLNNASIQNILENILNILSDSEDDNESFNKDESKYIKIIYDLLDQLKDDKKFEKAEFICDLIINTLIYNSDIHLIELILNDEKKTAMNNIKDIIENIIKKENNNKIMIPIMQLLCHLNDRFIRALNDSLPFTDKPSYLDSIISDNKKINTFEYQYFRNKIISSSKIVEAFKNNLLKYLTDINDIYMILARDIGEKWENHYQNKNTNNANTNGVKDYKFFELKNLYKWKYILISIKIYIISLYINNNSDNGYKHYFLDEKLFRISMELYLNHKENNIYQNIFSEMIMLICDERCPKYLIRPFLSLKEENKKSNFILKIVNKIRKLKELNSSDKKNIKKNNISVGVHFEILNYFFSSINKNILKHFDKNGAENKLEKKYKDIFLKSIKPKFERKIGGNYDYSESEIFDSNNDNDNTFDGNNISMHIEFPTMSKIIEIFSNKCKKEEINYNNKKNDNNIKNKMILNEDNSTHTIRIKKTDSDTIEISRTTENNDNKEIKREVKFTLKEEDNEDNLNEEIEQNEIQSSIDIEEIINKLEIILKYIQEIMKFNKINEYMPLQYFRLL